MISKRALHLFWVRIPILRELLLSYRKTRPVIVISFPRCGSSWTGAVLGRAKGAHLLSEPVNNLVRDGGYPIFAELDAKIEATVKEVIVSAPKMDSVALRFPSSWRIDRMPGSTLVIKEVALLATEAFLKYDPRVIFLRRHPVAVAKSLLESGVLGTVRKKFLETVSYREQLDFSNDLTLATSLYGYLLSHAVKVLAEYQDIRRVAFEDLCRNPIEEFGKLFAFAELPFTTSTVNMIKRLASRQDTEPFSVYRKTEDMPVSQLQRASKDETELIRSVWVRYNLPWYIDDSEWEVKI